MPSAKHSARASILAAAVVALGLTAASHARADVAVAAIVETEAAIFFQPANVPGVVWYMPRTITQLAPVAEAPGYWRASVALPEVPEGTLEELNPDWQGATLAPFIVRPASECSLERDPSMRFVQQEVRAQGRDVSAGIAVPVCQFSFRLPRPDDPALIERLQMAASTGGLIQYELVLSLHSAQTVPWSALHSAVAAQLPSSRLLTPASAATAVDEALAGESLASLVALTSAEELAELRAQMLSTLFTSAGSRKRFVAASPSGALTYHIDIHTYHL